MLSGTVVLSVYRYCGQSSDHGGQLSAPEEGRTCRLSLLAVCSRRGWEKPLGKQTTQTTFSHRIEEKSFPIVFYGNSSLFEGSTEGKKLPRNDPVEVSMLSLIVECVLVGVESADLDVTEGGGSGQGAATVDRFKLVRADPERGVSEWCQGRLDPQEWSVGFLCGPFHTEDLVFRESYEVEH